jgi:hypothetical protein
MKKADFGLFASYVYPLADVESLKVLTYWVIWVFAWDDECDLLDGDVTFSLAEGKAFRARTLRILQEFLGLAPSSSTST